MEILPLLVCITIAGIGVWLADRVLFAPQRMRCAELLFKRYMCTANDVIARMTPEQPTPDMTLVNECLAEIHYIYDVGLERITDRHLREIMKQKLEKAWQATDRWVIYYNVNDTWRRNNP